ncbi:MAG: alpha-amylase family glycosyl hydrolase [Deltaproteobacteria bacterium]|nr:alpha-amylase family glycosyl hydrolase [Deltaproteobacteria bacterium]
MAAVKTEPAFGAADPDPSLYQINTRVWLRELSRRLGRTATLDDVPDVALDRLAQEGFDWVWFLGVWQTGEAGRQIALGHPGLLQEYRRVLPGLRDGDVCSSCFAVTGYTVHSGLGGNEALIRLRERLHQLGVRLLLDFVPNHVASDHPWTSEHPDFFVPGTEESLAREPQNYCRIQTAPGSRVLAHGRDPFFPGWTDTLQLNYGNPALQEAMMEELAKVAELGDGVRCDMAMLVLPEIFQRTWGIAAEPFWPKAIQRVRQSHPKFLFMAEVYWDLEWTLQQQGFDYTYDKRLYDRLREQHARPVWDHLRADRAFQNKSARFLEKHDESRAAATFPPKVHQAAAVLTFLVPGLRFFHQGQWAGWKRRLPVQLCRRPMEATDLEVQDYYRRLLACLRNPVVREGRWQILERVPAWEGNWTWDCFIAFSWEGKDGQRLLGVVNYAPNHSQCYVGLPFPDLGGGRFRLRDLMGTASYDREGDALMTKGLYLDMPEWGYHVFEMSKIG